MSTKRPRASSTLTQSAQSSTSSSSVPDAKQLRVSPTSGSRTFQCTLPPTCNTRPTDLASLKDLESHYATYHAHVCEEPRCGCVFPNERLLELHQAECHDPFIAVKKERGEKIFACLVVECNRRFSTPKTRRLHLIQAHNYPKEYFFAVTNKGVGGLLKKWGEGASLIRGEWKPRTAESDPTDLEGTSEDTSDDETDEVKYESISGMTVTKNDISPNAMENLTNAMDSLKFVPSNVRFGRGARSSRPPRTDGPRPVPNTHQRTHNTGAPASEAGEYYDFNARGLLNVRSTGRGRSAVRSRGHGRGSSGEIPVGQPSRRDATTDDEPVSINIEGALNVFKEEATATTSHTSQLPSRDLVYRFDLLPTAGRGRGRGRLNTVRGRGRGRGFLR